MAIVTVQRPDSLSLSGNLKELILQSPDPVSVTLKTGLTTVLEETYYPGNGNLVHIDFSDVVKSFLSFTLPSSDMYVQPDLAKDFTVNYDGQNYTFRCIRSGKMNLNESPSQFLKGNFLTWQPTQKAVTYYSPEWITYYAPEACRVRLQAYWEDGTSSLIILSSPSSGMCVTYNLQYAVVSGKFSGKRPMYYDVWVENLSGTRLSYVQRYVASEQQSEDENWYLFENSLGGLDSLRAYGALSDNPEYTHNLASFGDESEEYRVDSNRLMTRNTGMLTPEESRWLQDMFVSPHKYIYTLSGVYRIVFTSSDAKADTSKPPTSYTFTYRLSDSRPYLDIQRRTDLPDNLVIPIPNGETFFLPPRLAEFPKPTLSEDLLIPVQEPHTEVWGATTAGVLKDTVLNELIEHLDGLDLHPVQEGGGGEGPGTQYWDLIDKDANGEMLPLYKHYINTVYPAHTDGDFIAKGDVVAYAIDDSIDDLAFPFASYSTFGIVKIKENSGLIVVNGLLSIDPSYAGGGLDEEQLHQYLTTKKYVTEDGLKDYMKLTTPLTGYALPVSYAPITDKDTVLSALGKLEKNFVNYVDLTTNQTIGGVKTFTDTLFGKKDIVCYAADGSIEDISFPIASPTQLGMIKVGANLTISNGVLSAQSGGVSFTPGTALELTLSNVLNVKIGQDSGTVCAGNDGRLSDARRASDVYSWAKEDEKPTYTWSEITSKPSWIGATKPSYTFSDVGALSKDDERISGWSKAALNAHWHTNIDNLDTINQNLSNTSTPGFNALSVSSASPYYKLTNSGYNWAMAMPGTSNLEFQRQGNSVINFLPTGSILAVGDIVAYSNTGSISDITAIAGQNTYGVVKYDNNTIRMNASGQLYTTSSGGGGSTVSWGSGTVNTVFLNVDGTSKQLTLAGGFSVTNTSGSQYRTVKIVGVEMDLSLNGHTHSNYLTSLSRNTSGSGNVVTNVTVSGSTITVQYGNISTGGGSWNGGTVTSDITISKSSPKLSLYDSFTTRNWDLIHESSSGNPLTFKHYSTILATLNTSGNLWIYGTLTEKSDDRIKTRYDNVINVLQKICSIDVFRYIFNDNKTQAVQIGVSAQSLQRLYPELVSTEGEYLGVFYNRIGVIALQGVKELYRLHLDMENSINSLSSWRLTKDQQIKHLARENDLLKARVTELEGRAA